MSIKVLITDRISEGGVSLLRNEPLFSVEYLPGIKNFELEKKITDVEVLVIRTATQVDKNLLKHAKKLKLVCRVGVGTDNIDVATCAEMGIEVRNTPRGNRISTAEHAIALLMAISRNIAQATAALKNGLWDREKFTGVEIFGKTLGLIGLGNIGQEVAKRAQGLGLKVIAHDPYLAAKTAEETKVTLMSLNEVLERSDYISLHVPLTSETHGMAGQSFFNKMKKGSFFINTSRGGVVDEVALLEALKVDKIAGAALDVFLHEPLEKDNPLLREDRIILSPHLAGQTREALVELGKEAALQIQSFFKH